MIVRIMKQNTKNAKWEKKRIDFTGKPKDYADNYFPLRIKGTNIMVAIIGGDEAIVFNISRLEEFYEVFVEGGPLHELHDVRYHTMIINPDDKED